MATHRVGKAVCAVFCLLLGIARPGAATDDEPRLLLTIDYPTADGVIGDPGGQAFVSGKALALFGDLQTFDIVFVIDQSDSTSAPSGADVDDDGKVGRRKGSQWFSLLNKLPLPSNDKGDSVLAAEIAAVRVLLDQLDPRTTRVGIVAFSGDSDSLTPDSYTQVPLTSDYDTVHRGLDQILDDGPRGMTNMVSAVNTGTGELLGTRSAFSTRREGARRIMVFLTDGEPTLPLKSSRLENIRMTIDKANRAGKAGIRIDTYAIGEDALREPVVAVEMARVTQGVFTPILHPRDLRTVFEEVNFADIQNLAIRNATTASDATYKIQNPDGSYSALVPMQPGENVIEVSAETKEGARATRTVTVRFLEDGTITGLSPHQLSERNRLLENQLLDLQRRNLEIQMERDEAVRRDLQIEIEEQRAQANERADEMRRELELEVEE